MDYPVNCNKCNQPLYGPVKYCPFCGTDSVFVTEIPEKTMQDNVKVGLGGSSISEEHIPEISDKIKQEDEKAEDAVEAGDSLKENVPFNETSQQVETEIKLKENLQPPEKPVQQQKERPKLSDKSIPEKPEYKDIGKEKRKKQNRKLITLVATIVGIILVIAGFLYYNNINKSKLVQVQKEFTQKEEKLKKKAKKAEDSARKAEIERHKAKEAAMNAEIEKRNAKEKATALALAKQEADRQVIAQNLQDGIKYFGAARYELCIEKMKEVLKKDKNNYEAVLYMQKSQEKLDQALKEFEHPVVGRSR